MSYNKQNKIHRSFTMMPANYFIQNSLVKFTFNYLGRAQVLSGSTQKGTLLSVCKSQELSPGHSDVTVTGTQVRTEHAELLLPNLGLRTWQLPWDASISNNSTKK